MRSDAEVFRRLQKADWETIGKKLVVYARRRAQYYHWRGGGRFELAVGYTITDIVQEAITQACSGERKWDPEKGALEMWLKYQVNSIMDGLAKLAANRNEIQGLEVVTSDGEGGEVVSDILEYDTPASARKPSAEAVAVNKEEAAERIDELLTQIWPKIEPQVDK
ncbi:hypothetical protein LCGC14_0926010 [marine sediment metagenome]|uniref:Uncharacterized protein n=1 Tax=marine sediment metagenome TaxID=412755 RepID=A0A0F9NU93_9ZZZZ